MGEGNGAIVNGDYKMVNVAANGNGNVGHETKDENMLEGNVKLKKQIGILGSSALLIGTIIGSGIFASPTSVASNVVSSGASLVVWVACGVLAMLAALSYCELGSMYPNASGGEYYYLLQAFGPIPAFLYAYVSTIVIRPSSLSIIALVCGRYTLIAILGYDIEVYSKLIGAAVILIILVVNCLSVRWATLTQVIFTAAKLIAVVMIIITGFVRLGQGHTDSFKNSFNGTTGSVSKFGYALYGGLWAYDGWNNLNFVTEEMTNPVRDLPRALLLSVPFITACYVAMNVAYLTVMNSAQLAASNAVAVTLSNQLYGVMSWIIPILVACSTFGAANGTAFTSGRLVYVAAKEGHFPSLLAMIHRKRLTPLPALVFTCIIALIMLFPPSSNFNSLINYFSFAAWTFYGANFAALIWLRIRKRDLERPYKVFIGIPIICLICSIYLVVAPFYDDPLESFLCLLFILSGLLVYFVCIHRKWIPACVTKAYNKLVERLDVYLALPSSEEELNEIYT